MTKSLFTALLAATALTACAAGPDYRPPVTPPTAAAPFIGTATPAVSAAEVEGDWWRLYDDPLLDRLVGDALRANTDIRVAVARLERARSTLRGARSDRLPSTSLDGTVTYGRTAAAQSFPGIDRENRTVDAGFSVGYEVDLFGRVKRSVEAARGDLGAAEADADAVRVAVVADTVRAYAVSYTHLTLPTICSV